METLAINSDLSKQETEDQALLFDGIVASWASLSLSSPAPAEPEAQHTLGSEDAELCAESQQLL